MNMVSETYVVRKIIRGFKTLRKYFLEEEKEFTKSPSINFNFQNYFSNVYVI